jgi:streptogramin lyase
VKQYLSGPFLVGFLLTGCAPEPAPKGHEPSDTTPGTTTTTGPTADTADTGRAGTTDTAVTPPYEFDCTTVPPTPGALTPVDAARGSYDLIFDDIGNIVGWDNGLVKADAYGNAQMWSPPVGISQGMAWLPDGDLAVAEIETRALLRVDHNTGGTSLISSEIGAYGVKMGPDGKLWAGTDENGGNLVRVDPATGARELLVDDPRFNARSIDFSPDYTKLYMGTYFGDGRVWVVDLDANYDIVGDPYVFADNVGNGIEHDALGVDFCGNVYVVDYGTLTMYRLTPDGQKSVYLEFSNEHYGHGIAWGSGIGGWSPTTIYLPEPWYGDTVISIEVGVPSRSYAP